MSEYQYYEFQAIDMPLTRKEMDELRSLYLGWLLCAQEELYYEEDEEEYDVDGGDYEAEGDEYEPGGEQPESRSEEVEPPVPPGLANLTASQRSLADFLRIDDGLIAVASERSRGSAVEPPSLDQLQDWVRGLPEPEKTSLLLQFLRGDNPHLRTEINKRFQQAGPAGQGNLEKDIAGKSRAVRQLVADASQRAEARRRAEVERKERERAERQRAQAAARARYLDGLSGSEEEIWGQAEALIGTKNPERYDQAIELLKDLRDLSTRKGQADLFRVRLGQLRDRHARKPSLLKRIDEARLK